MPLERDNTSPMYRLGRVWALAEAYAEQAGGLSSSILDVALVQPLDGLALLQRELAAKIKGDGVGSLEDGIAQILDGAQDLPAGPLPMEEQGPFWLGYYHQRAGQRLRLTAGDLRRAGEALYGEQWQSDLSRALSLSSTRRVREWIERGGPPVWVRAEVYALLRAKSRETEAIAKALISKDMSQDS
ncbi:type I-C CRISPR-associated protein Cas8c/Csd1 [Xanthobacter oligotrophicus]|uniref:Type I-C CRISPR-associated protein Cas8c/Csd1 n=1 Tax=Xanthobacter oligotrophicus TaxID=2607286 RepID=A0ABW6ZPZ2_9HYPH